MSFLSRIFLKGVATVLPLALTVALVVWLAGKAESVLGGLLRKVILDSGYVPGMGLIVGVLLVFGVGLLTHVWLFKKVIKGCESVLLSLPVIKSIYSAVNDFFKYLTQPKTEGMDQVVSVEFPNIQAKVIGFVTRNDLDGLPDALGDQDTIAVYFPMSFQIAGYTLFLPKSRVTRLDLSLEEGMRLALTAGMTMQTTKNAVRED